MRSGTTKKFRLKNLNKNFGVKNSTKRFYFDFFSLFCRLILKYAVDWNAMQDKMIAKKNLLDAWRQVAEMLLCSIPNDQIQAQQKQRLLLELIQFLLNKVILKILIWFWRENSKFLLNRSWPMEQC